MIYYAHAESVSPGTPGTSGARVRIAHGDVRGSRCSVRHRRRPRCCAGCSDNVRPARSTRSPRRAAGSRRSIGRSCNGLSTNAPTRRLVNSRARTTGSRPTAACIGPASGGPSGGPDTCSKKTLAAGGARPYPRPNRAGGVPRVGVHDRSPTVGISGRIRREYRDGALPRVVAARPRVD
jgi:hypothetical protein